MYHVYYLKKMSVTHLSNPVRTQHLAIHKEQLPEASRDFGLLLLVFVTVEVGVGRVHLVADVPAHALHVSCVNIINTNRIVG